MSQRDLCLEAKKGGKLGLILSIIGHLILGTLGILIALVFLVPSLSIILMVFLYYFGVVFAIVGGALAISGAIIKRKEYKVCSIV